MPFLKPTLKEIRKEVKRVKCYNKHNYMLVIVVSSCKKQSDIRCCSVVIFAATTTKSIRVFLYAGGTPREECLNASDT